MGRDAPRYGGWRKALLGLAATCLVLNPAAAVLSGERDIHAAPPTLAALIVNPPVDPSVPAGPALAAGLRLEAIRDAAAALGAEAGLARRTWEYAATLEREAARLDAVWRFDALMIDFASFRLAPPVVRHATDAAKVTDQAAARARHVWRILAPARFVTAAPHWRDWLVREPRSPAPLAAVFLPRTAAERATFDTALRGGWAEGIALAHAIQANDVAALTGTWLGMVEYHRLRAAGMVTAPRLVEDRTATSGGGRVLHVDERSAALREPARLDPVTDAWRVLEVR